MKSFLAVRGIPYESVDVSADPGGLDRLVALGASSTPVIAIGDRWVRGSAYDQLDSFLAEALAPAAGTPGSDVGRAVGDVFAAKTGARVLDEGELVQRLDGLLGKAAAYMGRIGPDLLRDALPARGREGRTVLGLAYHISSVARDPLRAVAGVRITKDMHGYDPPPELVSAEHVERRIRLARADLADWWDTADRTALDYPVDTYEAPYAFHGLLERAAWHVATHLRQLAWVLVEAGVDPDAGLTEAELADLPVPPVVWR